MKTYLYVNCVHAIPRYVGGEKSIHELTTKNGTTSFHDSKEFEQQCICIDNIDDIQLVDKELETEESLNYFDLENTVLYKFCKPFIKDIYTEYQELGDNSSFTYMGSACITDIFGETHKCSAWLCTNTTTPENELIYKALSVFYKCIKFVFIWGSQGVKNECNTNS